MGIRSPAFFVGFPRVCGRGPSGPLSAAMERLYEDYPAVAAQKNELSSKFRYTRLEGFDYHGHDGIPLLEVGL